MPQDLRDQRWVFNTGNDSELAAALGTGLDVDGEDPLEVLHPAHGGSGFVSFRRALCSLRHGFFFMSFPPFRDLTKISGLCFFKGQRGLEDASTAAPTILCAILQSKYIPFMRH